MKKSLNCSKTNEHFHPLNAFVEVNGYPASIESHAMYAKRIRKNGLIVPPADIAEVEKYDAVGFVCRGMLLPYTYFPYYIGLLWHKYLSENETLVKELSGYNDYRDFNQYTDFSHAQYLKRYMDCSAKGNKGQRRLPGELLMEWLSPLTDVLTGKNTIIIEKEQSIKDSIAEVVAFIYESDKDHQAEKTEYYREFCPVVYRNYRKYMSKKTMEMAGSCFVQENEQTQLQKMLNKKHNIFINDQQRVAFLTLSQGNEEVDFHNAIRSLKDFAKKKNLAVALPYHLGADVKSKKWKSRYNILKEVFADYYVILHEQV